VGRLIAGVATGVGAVGTGVGCGPTAIPIKSAAAATEDFRDTGTYIS
jgi:F0F1-type ATP synthase membrane subunit c/vacuolar-type H+-ATPase subunit K